MKFERRHGVLSATTIVTAFICCGCGTDAPSTGNSQTVSAPVKTVKSPIPRPTPTPILSRAEIRKRERAAEKEARRKKREAKMIADEKRRKEAAKGKARKYTIVKTEDSGIAGMIRYTMRIVVPKDIRAVDVRPTAEKIVADQLAEFAEIDELALFLYKGLPADGVYDVASVDWAPNGQWGSTTSSIAESNDRSSYRLNIQTATNLP